MLSNFVGMRELFDTNRKLDILTLSETHITTDEDNDELYEIPGYTFVKRNRTAGLGGGVAGLYQKWHRISKVFGFRK